MPKQPAPAERQSKSDLQKLIEEFELVKKRLEDLASSDANAEATVAQAREKLNELYGYSKTVLAANERTRREALVKLQNLQELLRPIVFPMGSVCVNQYPMTRHPITQPVDEDTVFGINRNKV